MAWSGSARARPRIAAPRLRQRSGRRDACALQLRTQAVDLVDQFEHRADSLQVGFEIALQATDPAHARQLLAAEAPLGVRDGRREQPFVDQQAHEVFVGAAGQCEGLQAEPLLAEGGFFASNTSTLR